MTMLKEAHSPIEIDSTLTMTNVEDPRPSMRYELTVRNKFIGVGDQPPALREMANALRAQAEFFEALDDPRIEYDSSEWKNDYHLFYTDDETIAEKFGFDEISDESDEDNDFDEDDEG